MWHTHPFNFGPDITCQEDIWYVLSGEGTMYYKLSGVLKSFEFKKGDIVHSKHLTNYTWNTGQDLLVIPFFEIPRLPYDENAYENLRYLTPAAIPEEARPLDPPVLVHEEDVEIIYPFKDGKAGIRPLITPQTAQSKHGNVGTFIAQPGQGLIGTHPVEVWKGFPEEDLSYVIKGTGTLYFRLNDKQYELPLRAGDMVFTGHLSHCIRNTGNDELVMLCLLAPNNRASAGEIPDICP